MGAEKSEDTNYAADSRSDLHSILELGVVIEVERRYAAMFFEQTFGGIRVLGEKSETYACWAAVKFDNERGYLYAKRVNAAAGGKTLIATMLGDDEMSSPETDDSLSAVR